MSANASQEKEAPREPTDAVLPHVPMVSEASAVRTLFETASFMLAVWLAQSHLEGEIVRDEPRTRHCLDNARLRRVLDYIAHHLDEEISVADLAKVACLSIFHFTRMFAASVGMPPHRYVSRQRLEHAMTLLACGKLPLSQIALACRFSSQASFTRAFRRAAGLTPGEYRRLFR